MVRSQLGIVEGRSGLTAQAEQRFRAALAVSEKAGSRQPADRVEIYVRLAQLLVASGRREEAVTVAREGLQTAESAYAAFFDTHPFVGDLRRLRE
jgi:hypothetical protein